MSTPSETAFGDVKNNEKYKDQYIDDFKLNKDKTNPLMSVVPNKADDFFPSKVCNIVCITGPYTDWKDDTKFKDSFTRLKEVFKDYSKYETHFIFDADADEYKKLSNTTKDDMKTDFQKLADDGKEYGLFFWGEQTSTNLYKKLVEIIDKFYKPKED